MIVFHCKCKRPAVISLKVENSKESTKDSFSKYCKVDRVQRHKADSHKLQGTGEFLRLSLPGLLHGSGDKGCSGSLSSARSADRRRLSVPWMFFPFEEKAAAEESEQCWQVAAPQAAGLHAHSSRTHHFLRAQRHSSKSQRHRPEEVPAHLRKRAWKMGWCWLYCCRVRLRNDSASFLYTLHIHYSSWWLVLQLVP